MIGAPRAAALVLAAPALAVIVALAACGEGEVSSSAPTRGPRRGAAAPLATPPPSTPPGRGGGAGPPRPRFRDSTPSPSPSGALGVYEVTELETDEGAPAQPAARNLPEELRAALGVPQECLPADVASTLGTELRLPVRVWVTETGRVTRAEVGGSAPASVRDCVQRRAEAISMRGPIERAPRDVSTQLVIAIRRQDAPAPAAAPGWRTPEGAQAPALTLPATGPQGPPRGAVPPGSTLPAVAPGGRPPGFVPPSSTLPAIAE